MAPVDTSSAMHLVPMPAEEAPKPAEKPKTLYALLQALSACDDDMQNVVLDEELDLIEGGKVKVDNYKFLIDHLEAQEALFKKWEDEYKAARKAVESNAQRLKNHMVFALQKNGFTKFTGFQYVVDLRKAKPSVIVKGTASDRMKIRYGNMIRVKYEFDKDVIGDALKAGDPLAAEIANFQVTLWPKFSVIKGV